MAHAHDHVPIFRTLLSCCLPWKGTLVSALPYQIIPESARTAEKYRFTKTTDRIVKGKQVRELLKYEIGRIHFRL